MPHHDLQEHALVSARTNVKQLVDLLLTQRFLQVALKAQLAGQLVFVEEFVQRQPKLECQIYSHADPISHLILQAHRKHLHFVVALHLFSSNIT